jgi:hypothetical protein
MLQINNLGHSSPEQCEQLVERFARIEDPDVRKKVLELMEDLAAETGELLTVDDLTPLA